MSVCPRKHHLANAVDDGRMNGPIALADILTQRCIIQRHADCSPMVSIVLSNDGFCT